MDDTLWGWVKQVPEMTQTMFLEKPPKTEECLANVIIWPHTLPSGKRLHSYWKWPFIVDLPIKMVIFHSYVSLPEGNNLNNCFPNEGNLLVDMVSTTSSEPPRATDRGILEYYRRTCFFWDILSISTGEIVVDIDILPIAGFKHLLLSIWRGTMMFNRLFRSKLDMLALRTN